MILVPMGSECDTELPLCFISRLMKVRVFDPPDFEPSRATYYMWYGRLTVSRRLISIYTTNG